MIHKLALKDYRSHELTRMDLDNFNLLVGPFGSGKSSCLHALALLLCGSNMQVNLKGQGLRDEIRYGAEEFTLAANLNGNTQVERKVNSDKHTMGLNGNFQNVAKNQAVLMASLHATEDLILALLDPRIFLDRDEASQKKTLIQFMRQGEIKVPVTVAKLGLTFEIQSASHIDTLIKEVKEERIRKLNRERGEMEASLPEVQEFEPNRLKEVKFDLGRLHTKRDQAIRQDEAAKHYKSELERLNQAVVQACSDACPPPTRDFSVKDAKESLAHSIKEAEDRVEFLSKQVQDLREAFRKKQEALSEGERQVARANATVANLEGQQATVGKMGKKCGVIDIFNCPLEDKDKKKMGGILSGNLEVERKNVKALEKALATFQQQKAEVEAVGKKATEDKATVERTLTDLQAKLARVEAAAKDYERHMDTQAPEGSTLDLAKISEEIASKEIDKANLERVEQEVATRAIRVKEIQSNVAKCAELAQAVEELTKLKQDIMAKASGGFLTEMREFLKPFGLGEVELKTDPFGFFINSLPGKQLSGGQRVLFDAALRVAAAKASGLGVIGLDDANKLGEETRKLLAEALGNAKIQCILICTTDKKPSAMRGVKIWWFENTNPPLGPTKVTELYKNKE